MAKHLTLPNLSIFSGYSHIGWCREFVWIPGDIIGRQRMSSSFTIRGLKCSYEIEALMIRKDLYLQAEDGKEYVVINFRLTDVDDPDNIGGVADSCEVLFEKFPEMKTITEGEQIAVSKQTQVMAFKAVSGIMNNVRIGQSIETQSAKEVVGHMVDEVTENQDAILNLMNIKSFDDYTFTHNINVATISCLIGQQIGLSHDQLKELGMGGLLHDVGKLKIPLAILNKDGKLSDEEFKEMKRHSTYGYEILQKAKDLSENVRLVALQHHEKVNGKGYPKGLTGETISRNARICAVADVYDALTTDRPYRTAMAPYDAVKILMAGVDSQFDAQVMDAFLRKFSIYPSGSLVQLNDNSVGLILKVNPKSVLRPVIKLLMDRNRKRVKDRAEIDLMGEKNLFIRGPAAASMLNVTEGSL